MLIARRGAPETTQSSPEGKPHRGHRRADRLKWFHELYATRGEIPDLSTSFATDLFNTYRSYLFPQPTRSIRRSMPTPAATCSSRSAPTAAPGSPSFRRPSRARVRGDHYHLRKIERFCVVKGEADIQLRRLLHDEVVTFRVERRRSPASSTCRRCGCTTSATSATTTWSRCSGPTSCSTRRAQTSTPRRLEAHDEGHDDRRHATGDHPARVVIERLDSTVEHVLVHTGQNYDHSLNQVFFDDLGLRAPDHYLDVDTSSLGRVSARPSSRPRSARARAARTRSWCSATPTPASPRSWPSGCGSRSTTWRPATAASTRTCPRRPTAGWSTTSRTSTSPTPSTPAATCWPRACTLAGSSSPARPCARCWSTTATQIDASDVLDRLDLDPHGYFLVSAHREENVDSPERLRMLLDCLVRVHESWDLPVVVSTHPRTRKRLEALVADIGLDGDPVDGAVRLPRLQPTPARRRLRALRLRHHRRGVLDPRLPGHHAARLHRAP